MSGGGGVDVVRSYHAARWSCMITDGGLQTHFVMSYCSLLDGEVSLKGNDGHS